MFKTVLVFILDEDKMGEQKSTFRMILSIIVGYSARKFALNVNFTHLVCGGLLINEGLLC